MRVAPSALRLRGSRAETRDSGTSGGDLATVKLPGVPLRLLLDFARRPRGKSLAIGSHAQSAACTWVELPDLDARLLSLGSARDGARLCSKTSRGRASLSLSIKARSARGPSTPWFPSGDEGLRDLAGSDLALVEFPTLLLRLLLDYARRPRGKNTRLRHFARSPRGGGPRYR
jgi:hypothetical protein